MWVGRGVKGWTGGGNVESQSGTVELRWRVTNCFVSLLSLRS